MQKMDLKDKNNGNQKYENYQKENHIKNYEWNLIDFFYMYKI